LYIFLIAVDQVVHLHVGIWRDSLQVHTLPTERVGHLLRAYSDDHEPRKVRRSTNRFLLLTAEAMYANL
jgi:hypothetical protein